MPEGTMTFARARARGTRIRSNERDNSGSAVAVIARVIVPSIFFHLRARIEA